MCKKRPEGFLLSKIVIIGSGVAGLSAGITARLNGDDAVILEKHTVPGGNLTGWDRGGYHVDNCIHWLTGTNPLTKTYEMWKTLGAIDKDGIYYPESLYTYEKDGRSISLYSDAARLRRRMIDLSPADEKETERFIRAVRAASSVCGVDPENSEKKCAAARGILRCPALAPYYFLTAGELAARFRDPLLRGFIREFLTEDFGALGLIFVFAVFVSKNGGLPRGSSRDMAERMTAKFTSLGGRLVTGADVVKIRMHGSRARSVVLKNGREIRADYVVPACDPSAVFGRMIDGRYMPAALKRRFESPRYFRFSSCHAAFSFEGRVPFTGDLIVDLPESKRGGMKAKTVVLREYSRESSFAPEGHGIIQTMFFCDEDESERIVSLGRDPRKYAEEKKRIGERMKDVVLTRFPELSPSLEQLDVWTPATYNGFTSSEAGTYMAFAFSSKTVPSFMDGRVRGLDNVVLATQWQRAPGGLPNAAFAGVRAADCISSLERRNHK